jgi:hypothetical protein
MYISSVLVKGASAEVEITLRGADNNVPPKGIPLEQFAANKDMGRILLRRNGETIAAGGGFLFYFYLVPVFLPTFNC